MAMSSDDDRHVVDRGSVASQDDEVVEVVALEADATVDRVVPGDLAGGDTETDDRGEPAATRRAVSSAGSRPQRPSYLNAAPLGSAFRCVSSSSVVQKQR
jgi:hypothetical protein